jgi:hypothetical protein
MQSRSVLDIPLFHKIYDLYKLLHSYHLSIPKAQRYTLWQKCENITLGLLEVLIESRHYSGEKRLQFLWVISNKLDLLKVFIRLAKETYLINSQQYLAIQILLQDIGKMIGGWIKSVPH